MADSVAPASLIFGICGIAWLKPDARLLSMGARQHFRGRIMLANENPIGPQHRPESSQTRIRINEMMQRASTND
jgi:hypothetical protein